MALNETNPKFPGPYMKTCEADDPYMKRVNVTKAEIGSRPSGMPKGIDNLASLEHVGGTAGKR